MTLKLEVEPGWFIEVKYLTGHPIRIYPPGKSWPRETQCLIFFNGMLKGSGTVVKHELDKDNLSFAMKLATKKAITCIPFKDIRTKIWALLDKKIKETNV